MGRRSQLDGEITAATQRVRVHIYHIATSEDVMVFQGPAARYMANEYAKNEAGFQQRVNDAVHLATLHAELCEGLQERNAEITRLSRQLAEMTAERDKLREKPSLEKRVETLEAVARSYTVYAQL